MKKILRLVTTSVLTLTLVACGETAVTSSANTGGTTTTGTGTVSSASSAYANVTSVTLSAASNTLTQVAGALQRVTVSATLNANTNPTLTLEWFVDGVKSNQTGRSFEFTPNKGGTFAIQARVGSLSSNVLNVVVGQAAITSAAFVDANTLEVVAPGGATATVAGQTVADTSFYDLKNGKYVIDLEDDLVQGTEVTVSLARDGFQALTQKVIYDTREFKLSSVRFTTPAGTLAVVAAGGVYKVERPFDEGAQFNRKYAVAFTALNITEKNTTSEYKVQTTVPTGATAIPDSSELVNAPGTKEFVVTNTTALGVYTHTFTFGGKVVETKVEVIDALPQINLVTTTQWNRNVGANDRFEMVYGPDADNDTPFALGALDDVYTNQAPVALDASGAYVITKPFETYTNKLYGLQFSFIAKNFKKLDFVNNQYSLSISGPTSFSSAVTPLFSGIETLRTGNPNSALMTSLSMQNFAGSISVTGAAATTSANVTVQQFIDSGTPVGTYTFKISAGTTDNQVVKEVVVKIEAPKPVINFYLDSYNSLETSQTRDQVVEQLADGTYVLEKPTSAGVTYNLGFFAALLNYQSKLLTANEFAEVTADSLVTKLSDRKLFTGTTFVGTEKAFNTDQLLVPKGVTTAVDVFAYITNLNTTTDDVVTIVAGAASNPVNSKLTLVANTPLTIIKNSTKLYKIGTYTTATDAPIDQVATFTIDPATELADADTFFANFDASAGAAGNIDVFSVVVSDYPDVIELGGRDLVSTETANHRFVNISVDLQGPSELIKEVPLTRSAILLNNLTDGLIMFNQTGAVLNAAAAKYTKTLGKLSFDSNGALSSDTNVAASSYDEDDFLDDSGLVRNRLAITNTTVEGNYLITFMADDVVREVKLQIKQAQPKVFVLSGLDSDANVPPLDDDYNLGTTLYSTTLNAIKVFDADSDDNLTTEAAGDLYIVPSANGEYNLELPATATDHIIYANIAVVDLAKGSYNYSISKTYPDGRTENFADIVEVVSLDKNGLAVFAGASGAQAARNQLFINNWKISETSFEEGVYEYSFTIGSASRKIVINAINPPSFKINSLSINGVNLGLFNKVYRVLHTGLVGDVKAMVETQNLLETDLFAIQVAETDSGDANNVSVVDIGTSIATGSTTDAAALKSLKDLKTLDLGSILLAAGASLGAESIYLNDTFVYTVKFFRLKSRAGLIATAWPYEEIGSQTITVRVDN
jgi:hypothetical protein